MMPDLLLKKVDAENYDLSFEDGDLAVTDSVENLIVISVGSQARSSGNVFSKNLQCDGWWAEKTFGDEKWGGLVHTLFSRKSDSNTVILAKAYIEDSLKWLVDNGIVESVEVSVSNELEKIVSEISVKKNGEKNDYRFEFLKGGENA